MRYECFYYVTVRSTHGGRFTKARKPVETPGYDAADAAQDRDPDTVQPPVRLTPVSNVYILWLRMSLLVVSYIIW